MLVTVSLSLVALGYLFFCVIFTLLWGPKLRRCPTVIILLFCTLWPLSIMAAALVTTVERKK